MMRDRHRTRRGGPCRLVDGTRFQRLSEKGGDRTLGFGPKPKIYGTKRGALSPPFGQPLRSLSQEDETRVAPTRVIEQGTQLAGPGLPNAPSAPPLEQPETREHRKLD
jgi:hypothetical protein